MESPHRAADGRVGGLNQLDQATIHVELEELASAHRALWLADVLPSGACLLWGGGATLASVLASDGRSVLLVEPRPGDREDAARRAGRGVLVRGRDALTDATTADSVVVVAASGASLEGLHAVLARPLARTAALAVVVDADREAEVTDAVQHAGREVTVVRNELRLASTVALGPDAQDERPQVTSLGDTSGPEPSAVLVLAGIDAVPSVAIGADAGPAAWWSDTAALRDLLQRIDEEMTASHLERQRELEQAVADAEQRWRDAETRLAALLASTSWRATAPLRRAADVVKRR